MIPPEIFLNTILIVFLSNSISLIFFALFLQSYERTVQSVFNMIENVLDTLTKYNNENYEEDDVEDDETEDDVEDDETEDDVEDDETEDYEEDNTEETEDCEDDNTEDVEEEAHGYLQT
jgi:hypothetical protein